MTRPIRFPVRLAPGLLLVLAGVQSAHAQDPTEPPPAGSTEPAPAAAAPAAAPTGGWSNYNTRPLTLSAGMFGLHGDLVVNMSRDAFAKPIWITPNFYYGLTDQLTIGIAHNPKAEFTPFGGGICLGGNERGCGEVYNNVSLDILFAFLREAAMQVAGHGGLDVGNFDPFAMSVRIGVLGRFVNGPLAVMADPSVSIAVTNRDNNGDGLSIPVRVGYQVSGQLNVGGITGIFGPFDGFGDAYAIPLGANAWFALDDRTDLGANFSFTNLAGQGGSGDGRVLALSANLRL